MFQFGGLSPQKHPVATGLVLMGKFIFSLGLKTLNNSWGGVFLSRKCVTYRPRCSPLR